MEDRWLRRGSSPNAAGETDRANGVGGVVVKGGGVVGVKGGGVVGVNGI